MQTTAVIICAVHAAKFAGARAVLDEMLLPALKLRVGVGSAVIRRSRYHGLARRASAVNKLEGVQMPRPTRPRSIMVAMAVMVMVQVSFVRSVR